jgi:hypothetical protein
VLHVEVELEVGTGSSHNLISQYDHLICQCWLMRSGELDKVRVYIRGQR